MVKNLENVCFIYFYLISEAFQLFSSKKLEHSTSPIYYQVLSLLNEMSSMNKNERVACNERGGEYTCKDASRHRRTCDVLKCSICNFYTYSSVELTYHIKKKAFFCQRNVKYGKDTQQSPNTLQEKINLILKKKLKA